MAVSINHSMREAFKSCPRKVYWSSVAGVETKRKGLALMVGSAFHKGLEHWRTYKGSEPAMARLEAISMLTAEMQGQDYPPNVIEDECAKLFAYLAGYFEQFKGDIPSMGGLTAEAKITTVDEHGTLDAWWIDAKGEVWLLDDKTRSEFPPEIELILPLNEQLMNYALLLRATSRNVVGAIWRETKKSLTRRRKDETANDYLERLLDEYEGPMGGQYYRETTIRFNQAALDCYAEEKKVIDHGIRLLIGVAPSVNKWPHNGASCVGAYGNCEYLKLCAGSRNAICNFKQRKGAIDGGRYWESVRQAGDGLPTTAGGGTSADSGPGTKQA